MSAGEDPLLIVSDLTVVYRTPSGPARALEAVGLRLRKGEVLGIVGETGCGKSTLALALMRLLPSNADVISGRIMFKGLELTRLGEREFRQLRGTEMAMIFQEPLSSLNPLYTVGEQLAEAIRIRRQRKEGRGRRAGGTAGQGPYYYPPTSASFAELPSLSLRARLLGTLRAGHPPRAEGEFDEVVRYLRTVRISDPEEAARKYPHELSGGMRQRVMIAMALAQQPSLLIADEPTSALDVITQAQILKLLRQLAKEQGSSVMLISHDFGVIAETADRVAVMYAGQVVEEGDVQELFDQPLHPYTKMLLSALPRGYYDSPPLGVIPGSVPDPLFPPRGCRFHPRCPHAFQRCVGERPELRRVHKGQAAACFLYER
jgi:peptide/nickel transport system ATP-binding protein